MSPEQTLLEAETRKQIDAKLKSAGWVIQDKKRINLYASTGVAVREMDTDTGPADYMLFIDGKACGIIEAGTTVQIRDKLTKEKRLEILDQAEEYNIGQTGRFVTAPNQTRTKDNYSFGVTRHG